MGFGFASAMTSLFAMMAAVLRVAMVGLSHVLSWCIGKSLEVPETADDVDDGRYERIPWDGCQKLEDPASHGFFRKCLDTLIFLAIIAAIGYGLYLLGGFINRQFGKFWLFGWGLAVIAFAFILATWSMVQSKRKAKEVPPEFSPRFALENSVIGFDFNDLKLYMGDGRYPPRIFDFRAGDIVHAELLGRDLALREDSVYKAPARIRVHLNSISDPMRLVDFGDVDSAMKAMAGIKEMFALAESGRIAAADGQITAGRR